MCTGHSDIHNSILSQEQLDRYSMRFTCTSSTLDRPSPLYESSVSIRLVSNDGFACQASALRLRLCTVKKHSLISTILDMYTLTPQAAQCQELNMELHRRTDAESFVLEPRLRRKFAQGSSRSLKL